MLLHQIGNTLLTFEKIKNSQRPVFFLMTVSYDFHILPLVLLGFRIPNTIFDFL